ncbi:8-oxoguanine glycosylase ogg1 [Podila epigama]|nr:8-oxoguanine glycosylase ogg1 [Podila epigama]
MPPSRVTKTAPKAERVVASPIVPTATSSPASTLSPTIIRSSPWISFPVPRSELDLATTLKCGQSFRWHRSHRELPSGAFSRPLFSCVLGHRLWCIEETDDGFRYKTYRTGSFPSSSSGQQNSTESSFEVSEQELEEDKAFLQDYFQLQVPLASLYEKWAAVDPNFKAKAPLFPGIRILRQDPVENLICFICSANNNIARISQMATKICQEYGPSVTVPADDISDTPRTFHGFPAIAALAQDGVEEKLRSLGFGYRAKYIAQTAKKIHAMDNGLEWLMSLRTMSYEDAHAALLTLQGVGPKVADCICLMSLDKHRAIPVDTHVWQIAVRDYKFRFEGKVPKTMTGAIYKAIGKLFVDLYGDYAGWGNSVMFAADLRTIEGRVKVEEGVNIKIKAEEGNAKAEENVNIKIKVEEGNAKADEVEVEAMSKIRIKQEEDDGTNSMLTDHPQVDVQSTLRRQPKRRRP